MSAPETAILTELRTAMWDAVNGCSVLTGKFRKKYQSNSDIQGLLMQGISVSDLPAILITGAPFSPTMNTYALEEWPVSFRVDLYIPPDRWSDAELRIEQVIWAIRNQAPEDNPTVPYIRRLGADVMRLGPISITAGALQQASPLAASINQINQQQRCIVASATLQVDPVRNPFA
jgi:hypothetical protein